MENSMTLDEKIKLVKDKLQEIRPDCNWTVICHFWMDGTDKVHCRTGDVETGVIDIVEYYQDKLWYVKEELIEDCIAHETERILFSELELFKY